MNFLMWKNMEHYVRMNSMNIYVQLLLITPALQVIELSYPISCYLVLYFYASELF